MSICCGVSKANFSRPGTDKSMYTEDPIVLPSGLTILLDIRVLKL